MRYPNITARLFNAPLMIHPQKLDAIIAGISPRLFAASAQASDQSGYEMLAPELFSTKKMNRQDYERGFQVVDGVAVINISGATVHRSRMEADSTFLLGYNDITRQIESAMDNSDVHAVLRVYDSPGGEVNGAFEHAERIQALLGKKPMISIADSMAASAAYLAGSAADEVVITSTGYAGSIGVVMRHIDVSRAMANEGVQVTHIFAGDHKVDGNPFAPLPESVRADFQDEINTLYEMFIQAVSTQRGLSAEAIRGTQANTYRGQKAVSMGLADRVSTTDKLIEELAQKRSTRVHSIPANVSTSAKENATLPGMQQDKAASHISTKGVSTMTLEELRAAHPDLCAALVEEGRSAGFEAGASAELNRIKSVEAQSMRGHEALITSLKFDGKTTGPEAAVQVVNAERALQDKAASNLVSNSPDAVAFAAAPNDTAALEAESQADANMSVEDKAKATWDKDASLRAEFGNSFATYLSYAKAHAAGSVKVAGKSK